MTREQRERLERWCKSPIEYVAVVLSSDIRACLDALDAAEARVRELQAQRHADPARILAALKLAADAAEWGKYLADAIRECQHEPWRWRYGRYLASDWAYEAARDTAHDARAAMRLLGMEDV